jgi:hypothetical protein
MLAPTLLASDILTQPSAKSAALRDRATVADSGDAFARRLQEKREDSASRPDDADEPNGASSGPTNDRSAPTATAGTPASLNDAADSNTTGAEGTVDGSGRATGPANSTALPSGPDGQPSDNPQAAALATPNTTADPAAPPRPLTLDQLTALLASADPAQLALGLFGGGLRGAQGTAPLGTPFGRVSPESPKADDKSNAPAFGAPTAVPDGGSLPGARADAPRGIAPLANPATSSEDVTAHAPQPAPGDATDPASRADAAKNTKDDPLSSAAARPPGPTPTGPTPPRTVWSLLAVAGTLPSTKSSGGDLAANNKKSDASGPVALNPAEATAAQATRPIIAAAASGNPAGDQDHAALRHSDAATAHTAARGADDLAQFEARLAAGLAAAVERAQLDRSGRAEVTLRLHPASLGALRIAVRTDPRGLAIRFETTTPEAQSAIAARAHSLVDTLRERGTSVSDVRVELVSNAPSSGRETAIATASARVTDSASDADTPPAEFIPDDSANWFTLRVDALA